MGYTRIQLFRQGDMAILHAVQSEHVDTNQNEPTFRFGLSSVRINKSSPEKGDSFTYVADNIPRIVLVTWYKYRKKHFLYRNDDNTQHTLCALV
jgi:hypothetical protein